MSVGDVASAASAVVAFVALIVSAISLHKANKFGATADRLNRLLIEREQAETVALKKADLSANIVKVGRTNYRLKVFNRGKNIARNVRLIDLDLDSSLLPADELQRKFPIPVLEQHQSVELIVAVTLGSGVRVHIKLLWDDEAGKDNEKELTPVV